MKIIFKLQLILKMYIKLNNLYYKEKKKEKMNK